MWCDSLFIGVYLFVFKERYPKNIQENESYHKEEIETRIQSFEKRKIYIGLKVIPLLIVKKYLILIEKKIGICDCEMLY